MGITIIAILCFIAGIIRVLSACWIFSVGTMSAGALSSVNLAIGAILAGILTVAVALAYLALGYGAWTLQPWAWTVGMVIVVASLIVSLLSILFGTNTLAIEIVSIIVAGVLLYYLNTPGVKAAFGRA